MERNMAETIAEKIAESGIGPKRARGDAGEVEQHPLPDLIEADKYVAGKTAMAAKKLGVRYYKFILPDATGRA